VNAPQENISSLTKKEHLEYEAAKQRGYLVDRSRTRGNLEHD